MVVDRVFRLARPSCKIKIVRTIAGDVFENGSTTVQLDGCGYNVYVDIYIYIYIYREREFKA